MKYLKSYKLFEGISSEEVRDLFVNISDKGFSIILEKEGVYHHHRHILIKVNTHDAFRYEPFKLTDIKEELKESITYMIKYYHFRIVDIQIARPDRSKGDHYSNLEDMLNNPDYNEIELKMIKIYYNEVY